MTTTTPTVRVLGEDAYALLRCLEEIARTMRKLPDGRGYEIDAVVPAGDGQALRRALARLESEGSRALPNPHVLVYLVGRVLGALDAADRCRAQRL